MLERSEVTIDAECSTGETLQSALQGPLLRMLDPGPQNPPPPRSIRIRLLVADPAALKVFAVRDDGVLDPRLVERVERIARRSVLRLAEAMDRVKREQRVVDARWEVRVLPFPPTTKVYILNDEEALVGPYEYVQRSVDLGTEDQPEVVRFRDMGGMRTRLMRFSRLDQGGADTSENADAFESYRDAFESTWKRMGEPSELGS
jgi:hypothetical protein